MTSYRLTWRADQDPIDLYLYTFENFGLKQAERYAEGIRSCFALLAENPHIGRWADSVGPGIRRHERGGHVIFYLENPEPGSLLILAVIHSRQRPDLGLDDLT